MYYWMTKLTEQVLWGLYVKNLLSTRNTQVCTNFVSTMQLKNLILTHAVTVIIQIYSLICIEPNLIKIHWIRVPCNYPVRWTHCELVGNTTLKACLEEVLEKTIFSFTRGVIFHYRIMHDAVSEEHIPTLQNVLQWCGCKCF